ncbi:hypothetical protein T492DRAFT_958937 [Pavlovales sp. CCMP2436]|nr:hypothetical protein T492DRAFT_958937 [Pavlovales sp. CCMP2436]
MVSAWDCFGSDEENEATRPAAAPRASTHSPFTASRAMWAAGRGSSAADRWPLARARAELVADLRSRGVHAARALRAHAPYGPSLRASGSARSSAHSSHLRARAPGVLQESSRSPPGALPESFQSLPGVLPESSQSLPGVFPESSRSAPRALPEHSCSTTILSTFAAPGSPPSSGITLGSVAPGSSGSIRDHPGSVAPGR